MPFGEETAIWIDALQLKCAQRIFYLTILQMRLLWLLLDAIFCQREICRTITDGGGDYLFVVKDNQPELKADIAESFGDLSPLGAQRRTRRPAA